MKPERIVLGLAMELLVAGLLAWVFGGAGGLRSIGIWLWLGGFGVSSLPLALWLADLVGRWLRR